MNIWSIHADDPNKSFINDNDLDNFSSTPSFEVFEEVEVNQSLYVSSQWLAETRFHHVQPTKTVQVYLQRAIGLKNTSNDDSFQVDSKSSFFEKVAGFARNNLNGSAKSTPRMITKTRAYCYANKVEGIMSSWLVNRVWPSLTVILALCMYHLG